MGFGSLCLALLAAAAPPAPAREVRVAAAADLKFALEEIVREFREVHPDIAVEVAYGSSGNFTAQIESGAPFDLFLSADVEYVRQLSAQGLTVPGSDFVYAVGRLVLWLPRSSVLDGSRGLAVLRDPAARRIAIANPRHAPYGRAAVAALRALGVYADVQPKLVLGDNVAQAAQFVESGAADAGIIALSLALAPALASEGRYFEVPASAYPRLEQGGAILKAAKDPEAARALRDFVREARGRAVLERWGFLAPGP